VRLNARIRPSVESLTLYWSCKFFPPGGGAEAAQDRNRAHLQPHDSRTATVGWIGGEVAHRQVSYVRASTTARRDLSAGGVAPDRFARFRANVPNQADGTMENSTARIWRKALQGIRWTTALEPRDPPGWYTAMRKLDPKTV